MNNLKFLFRDSYETDEELAVLQELAPTNTFQNRTMIPPNSLVIGRFSVLPFYKELEDDLKVHNSRLINTYSEHLYIADMQNWYQDLKELTPHTWFSLQSYLADHYEGPVVLKGATNSKRELWRTHMLAANKDEARQVYLRLMDDGLIKTQNVYIRKFEKLVKYCDNIVGMPIVKEFRFFVLNQHLLCGGYYWGNFLEESGHPQETEVPVELLHKIIKKIGHNNNFYTIDVAQKETGEWIVIELNDGCMSGTNSIDPRKLYSAIIKQTENL